MKKVAKSGNKQKQKETSAEVERLEKEMAARHERELAQMKAQTSESKSDDLPAASEQRGSPEAGGGDQLEAAFYKQVNVSSRIKKKQILDERGLNIVDIAPDGDCLYNAVANQLSRVKGFEQQPPYTQDIAPYHCHLLRSMDHFLHGKRFAAVDEVTAVMHVFVRSKPTRFHRDVIHSPYPSLLQVTGKDMRRRAAKYIRDHKDDFIPFLANESDDPLDEFEFEKYCHGVENESKDGGVWGGEPELNALRPPVIFGEQFNKTKPLIIVYQRHAYQLGAHYNSTAVRTIS
ncbi:unnamed protein product [Heligmosomoides polygyrus]|uniref:OTU domain-containing protein n=1 Tax=Heligmosomoides polygyrus TaxID=6339 RepID=A0A183FIR3_HELPZ|nr:unnamed protein product [Heligmosomoides polygyrus]